MIVPVPGDRATSSARRWLPYALIGVGLPVGLLVVFSHPTSLPVLDYLVGGVLLAVALASVTHLIVRHSGPGERGPDF